MLKIIHVQCNQCGSCCGYNFHKCALPYAYWKWDKQHPELGLPLVKKIKEKIGDKVNVLDKVLIGKVNFNFYLSEDGLQTSETDKTCPFYDKTAKVRKCKIWNTFFLPNICKETPQNVCDEKTEKWTQDHPNCGFNWE